MSSAKYINGMFHKKWKKSFFEYNIETKDEYLLLFHLPFTEPKTENRSYIGGTILYYIKQTQQQEKKQCEERNKWDHTVETVFTTNLFLKQKRKK